MDYKNETILIETNFNKSHVITRRPIKWDEIDFPNEWILEEEVPPENQSNSEITKVEQTNNGTIKISFNNNSNRLLKNDNLSRSSSSSYISPIDYIIRSPSRASTSRLRENPRINNILIGKDNIVDTITDIDPTQSEMDFPTGIL